MVINDDYESIVEAESGPKAEKMIDDIEFRKKNNSWRKKFKFCPLGVYGPYNTKEEAKEKLIELVEEKFIESVDKTKKPKNR